jgi:hypothetical protein
MRTRIGSLEIKCDGCPSKVVVELNASPPPGWGRVSFELFGVARFDTQQIDGRTIDLCPKCVATLPWRKS